MTTLSNTQPDILSIAADDGTVTITLFVAKELDYFKGHFPGQPILPGVVQLHWAVEMAQNHLNLTSQVVSSVEVLKFQVVIPPDTQLVLTLNKKAANKFTFSYASSLGVHASGRIKVSE